MWLPFTQMQNVEVMRRIFVRGEGCFLYDDRGHRTFDAVSSIWTIVHGHGHPAIVEAIARQAALLDHATLLGATHPNAEELAVRLTELAAMDYAFFSSDGASAVEVALKMALQYWQNCGHSKRTKFVRLVDAYHGDTAGAMSVSDIAAFKARFGPITFETVEYHRASDMLARHDVAAVIVEPIVQAAAGMRIVPLATYEPLRDIEPLLVVDEIATGFGRTGAMFAFEHLNLQPDILCVGKGLSGGTLALSATLVRARIFDAFLGNHAEMKQLFHGHSFAGNPIACAAALASLELFDSDRTLDGARALADDLAVRLDSLRAHPLVRDVRQAGLMIGIELQAESIDAHGSLSPAWAVADRLYERGHFTRPIGDVIQLVPPLSAASTDAHDFLTALETILA
ncbi:MAG: adenosylmethionine--8-amino-7-oxononanoate transaminase [Candidatus Eremiobacteraeota bacterium]|nr:adenosylmethionine--8-amino-7-oxononanoate transaminase [Candidatus Eremiobacteraeota bacterium]